MDKEKGRVQREEALGGKTESHLGHVEFEAVMDHPNTNVSWRNGVGWFGRVLE